VETLHLTGRALTLEQVERVADGRLAVALDDEARDRMVRSRRYVESVVDGGDPVYGVTTGFGRMAEVVISPAQRAHLQRNLVRSHAAGVGRPLPTRVVRALMLLRANALAYGASGCRPVLVERLLELLAEGIHPVVPETGSVGASGDLAPLAHVARVLVGEGEVEAGDGGRRPALDALDDAGLAPLELDAKEGLALINGTQATTALGILAWLRARRAADALDVAGALSLEGLKGTPDAFRPEVGRVRPHRGQREVAARLTALLRGSEIRESHRTGDPRIQDAYSIRCMPQIHGAARQAMDYVRGVLETEANSVTDNPLIFPEEEAVISAGNFHAQVVAQALDFLRLALADLAAVSERRTERLRNPHQSGLPAFLAKEPGLESGFMIAQVTACDLLAEMRVLAHPASVDSVPTSANQEDHISMGLAAARATWRAVECLEYVVAVELLCAAEAVEAHRPLRSSSPLEGALERIRERVPPLDGDRAPSGDLEALRELVASGALTRLLEETTT